MKTDNITITRLWYKSFRAGIANGIQEILHIWMEKMLGFIMLVQGVMVLEISLKIAIVLYPKIGIEPID